MDEMKSKHSDKLKIDKLKMIIKVLVILLVLSLIGLAGRYIYLNYIKDSGNRTVTIPQNVIKESNQPDEHREIINEQNRTDQNINAPHLMASGNQAGVSSDGTESETSNSNRSDTADQHVTQTTAVEAPSIELDRHHPEYNEKFEVFDMLPGDSVTKYYSIKVHHGYDVKVYFETKVTEETKNLGEVLKIKVTDVTAGADQEVTILDDVFKTANGKTFSTLLQANDTEITQKFYRIDVSLDSSVGNPYQAAALMADFKWFVTDDEYNALLNQKPIIPGLPPSGSSGGPNTGLIFDRTCWGVFIGSAVLLIFLLILKKRRERRA